MRMDGSSSARRRYVGDPHVLLVDPNGERRRALARSMRVSGRRVSEASTPLEAIHCMGALAPPQMVAIAETWPLAVGEELRTYLLAEHGGIDVARMTWGRTL